MRRIRITRDTPFYSYPDGTEDSEHLWKPGDEGDVPDAHATFLVVTRAWAEYADATSGTSGSPQPQPEPNPSPDPDPEDEQDAAEPTDHTEEEPVL